MTDSLRSGYSQTGAALLSPAVKRALVWGGIAGAAAAAIRFGMIELEFFRRACEAPLPLWCWPRQALSLAADRWVYGAVSLAFGMYALIRPERTSVALAAVIVGAIGLALYDAGPASVGLVFGLATLARARS
jgi:hypothetical protein